MKYEIIGKSNFKQKIEDVGMGLLSFRCISDYLEEYIRVCIKRNGDKTQIQSTHYNALGFMTIVMT